VTDQAEADQAEAEMPKELPIVYSMHPHQTDLQRWPLGKKETYSMLEFYEISET
jgi:hypothetical protein